MTFKIARMASATSYSLNPLAVSPGNSLHWLRSNKTSGRKNDNNNNNRQVDSNGLQYNTRTSGQHRRNSGEDHNHRSISRWTTPIILLLIVNSFVTTLATDSPSCAPCTSTAHLSDSFSPSSSSLSSSSSSSETSPSSSLTEVISAISRSDMVMMDMKSEVNNRSPAIKRTVLVTGGAGYIGSHCVVALLERGFSVIVIDNLINSIQLPNTELPESLARAQILTKANITKFYRGDIGDKELLDKIFSTHKIDAVLHFAALKAVSESVRKPLEYYRNNVGSSLTLLDSMTKFGVKKIIFSSSATVYGSPQYLPLDEKHPIGQNVSNPYGRGKVMVENILIDLAASDPEWSIISLRYFNPIGAHSSGDIGEDPADIPNNLMPFITQVAVGRREKLSIFGADYETIDGTAIRDYIHIDDLISGHVSALDRMQESPQDWKGYHPLNLGTGSGTSVMQMVTSFQKATGITIRHEIAPRRTGDVPVLCAEASRANKNLLWTAKKSIQEACASSWKWQSQNPNGYRKTIEKQNS